MSEANDLIGRIDAALCGAPDESWRALLIDVRSALDRLSDASVHRELYGRSTSAMRLAVTEG